MHFKDRSQAGKMLADALAEHRNEDMVIYALPRGGVVLGVEIASRLDAPLDLVIPRKIGHPDQPEYGVCAVTEDGHLVCSKHEIAGLDPGWLTAEVQKQQAEAKRRIHEYLKDWAMPQIEGKTAIIVDDGVATGLTMLAAVEEVKDRHPSQIVLAAPVIPSDVADRLKRYVDELVALDIPTFYLGTVGAYYDKFEQLNDKAVVKLIEQHKSKTADATKR